MDSEYSDDTVGEAGVNAEKKISASHIRNVLKYAPVDAVVAVVSDGMLEGGTEDPSDEGGLLRIID